MPNDPQPKPANDSPQEARLEHDGFDIVSTTTSLEALKAEVEPPAESDKAARPAARRAAESDPPADPDPDGKAPAKTDDKTDEKPPAKKADAKTPEGRKAQLQAEINAFVREKHQVVGQTETAKAERAAIQKELDDAKAELDRVTKELETKKGGKADEKKPDAKADAKPADDSEPEEDAFEDFRDWVKAHSAWTLRQATKAADQRFEEHSKKSAEALQDAERKREHDAFVAQRAELAKKHQDRIAQYEAEHPTFKALMESAADLPVNPAIDEHILHSETGPALMRYLAENPEECERISALGWGPTLVELGKIEATKLGSAKSGSDPARRPATKAAPPVSPVGGSSAVADADDPDLASMPFDQYVKVMNARDKERATRRL
jgi:hypothetical protein